MNRSTPGLPVHHQLPEFTQTRVHRVSDAIQPSHPLSSPSPPAPNPSQHQSLFQWVNSLHEVAKVLEFHLQHHSLQRNPRADLLQNGLVGSPCSPRDSQESSPTPQFKSINSSALGPCLIVNSWSKILKGSYLLGSLTNSLQLPCRQWKWWDYLGICCFLAKTLVSAWKGVKMCTFRKWSASSGGSVVKSLPSSAGHRRDPWFGRTHVLWGS